MIPANIILTAYLATEYNTLLLNAVIAKINYSKSKKYFIFHFHTSKNKYQLLFSFSPPEFILIDDIINEKDNIEVWREIEDAMVTKISSIEGNRIIKFSLTRIDVGGIKKSFEIIFELFGSQTNCYLLDQNQIILQAIRVLKNRSNLKAKDKYFYPELLKNITEEHNLDIFKSEEFQFQLIVKENSYSIEVKPYAPSNLTISKTTPLVSLYQWQFSNQQQKQTFDERKEKYIKILDRRLMKTNNGISELNKKLDKCKDAEKIQIWADLLISNPNAEILENQAILFDFENQNEMNIPIEPEKTIIQNAEEYYKLARKLRKSPLRINQQVELLKRKVEELNIQISEINLSSRSRELEKCAEKYELIPKKIKSTTPKDKLQKYCRIFYTSTGDKVLVGKSNKANDELTFKIARSYDIWFHTQQAPGSHVVLVVTDKNKKPSQQSIQETAEIAAHFSSVRNSSNVPVVYTERGNVRKVRKGPPGQVIPQQVKSIFVDPKKPTEYTK